MQQFLESDEYFNQHHPQLKSWLKKITGSNKREKAISIFYLVRDGIRYDAFTFLAGASSLSSDFCLENKAAYCIPKATLQVTLSRAIGIPARLGLADVRNHLSSKKLDELLQNDIFTMHGYVEQHLEGKWVKSTPTFNKELCELANIKPLEFNGIDNAIFHQFTADGSKHMEYLTDHGTFAKMPLLFMQKNFNLHYPHISLSFLKNAQGEAQC